MAINLTLKYPGRITAPTLAYPYGSSKNETTPGAGDGTPYEIARADDIFGFQQALLRSASITPSNNSETALLSEYLQAIVELASGRAFTYDDSGAADAYVLDVKTNQQGTRSYFDGMRVKYLPGNTNTGPSTADVHGLGALNIKLPGGVIDPAAGVIVADKETTLVYRANPSAHLELQVSSIIATGTKVFTGVTGSGGASEDMAIPHGLGTDNIDFGMNIRGSNAVIVNKVKISAAMLGLNGRFMSVLEYNLSSPAPFINGSEPASGNIGIIVFNNSAVTQDITVDWWARVR